jgi:membrane protein implicated in regulation of membrane protease activity
MALFFGFGAVPLPFLIGGAMMGWGLTGVWATEYWYQRYGGAGAFWIPSMVVAIVGALAFEKLIAVAGAKLIPQTESASVSNVDLCELIGEVVYPVTSERGRIHIYDDYGTMHDVSARVTTGEPMIERGRKVLVVDYDAASDLLIVEPAP